MTNKLTITKLDDESFTIAINGDVVGRFTHDEHGWAGMEAAEKLARVIADKLNIKVDEIYGTEDA